MIELLWFAAGIALGSIVIVIAHIPKDRGTTTYWYRGQQVSRSDYFDLTRKQADAYARRLAKHLENREGRP